LLTKRIIRKAEVDAIQAYFDYEVEAMKEYITQPPASHNFPKGYAFWTPLDCKINFSMLRSIMLYCLQITEQ